MQFLAIVPHYCSVVGKGQKAGRFVSFLSCTQVVSMGKERTSQRKSEKGRKQKS